MSASELGSCRALADSSSKNAFNPAQYLVYERPSKLVIARNVHGTLLPT